jgi:thioesterase domain-containing protein
MSHLARLSKALPGYSIRLTGHSLGAGVAAVVAYMLNSRCIWLHRFVLLQQQAAG